ncbi:hypothetical protein CYMTET_48258 [Cymbomonas tetramitiformis]|uniref:Uncharacterized protein n=1 Tax=Cymbomonas tetramitiformis TaxID=36881 RepID=A0AAE0BSR3_9CHLO|nr:hypothetical protein CYMTET_48258 [Cymbomonas tetramitiformis]
MPTALLLDIRSDVNADPVSVVFGLKLLCKQIWESAPWEPVVVIRHGAPPLEVSPLGSPPNRTLEAIERVLAPEALKAAAASATDAPLDLAPLLSAGVGSLKAGLAMGQGAQAVLVTGHPTALANVPADVYSPCDACWLRVHVVALEVPSRPPQHGAAEAPEAPKAAPDVKAMQQSAAYRLVGATGGAFLCLRSASLSRGHSKQWWSTAMHHIADVHYPQFEAALRCGHLQCAISMHPNPSIMSLLPQPSPFPTTIAVIGFVDADTMLDHPMAAHFVLLGCGSVDLTEAPTPAPASLPPLVSLLRALLCTKPLATSSPSPTLAAVVALGPWAEGAHGWGSGNAGAMGLLRAVADDRGAAQASPSYHVVLSVIDTALSAHTPHTSGAAEISQRDQDDSLEGVSAFIKHFTKASRYIKKLPERASALQAECTALRQLAVALGCLHALQPLQELLDNEIEAQREVEREVETRLDAVEAPNAHQHQTRWAAQKATRTSAEVQQELEAAQETQDALVAALELLEGGPDMEPTTAHAMETDG